MYNSEPFRKTDESKLRIFVRAHPFATLVSDSGAGPFVSHVPLYLDADGASLVGHVARGNGHWRLEGARSTAIFLGPHAYISAAWYGTRDVVPTWNYVAVHVTGALGILDAAGTRRVLDRMIAEHEADPAAFHANMGDSVRAGLEKAIVGIALRIETWEGKWKLSQNKDAETRARLAQRLLNSDDEQARNVGRMMMPQDPR